MNLALSRIAVIVGLLTVAGGVGHVIAILVERSSAQITTYDSRYVHLLSIGGILVFVGLMNIGLYKWLMKGDKLAIGIVTYTSMSLIIYLLLLLPLGIGLGGFTVNFLILYTAYSVFLGKYLRATSKKGTY